MKKHIPSFDEFVNESKISHPGVEKAAVDLAYSMPNHTTPDKDGKFNEEQVEKAIKKYSPILAQHMRTGMKDQIIDRVLEIINESAINESTLNNFKPTVLDKKNSVDPKLFKKLMPRTSGTSEEAMERIWDFEGGTMFVHYQYFVVKPNGNKPDRPTYRIHNSQYWLNDAQLKWQGKSGQSVNTTLLTIYDVTDPNNEKNLGAVWVDTKVYLDEQTRVFEILNRQS
jgi:hypothetical protein